MQDPDIRCTITPRASAHLTTSPHLSTDPRLRGQQRATQQRTGWQTTTGEILLDGLANPRMTFCVFPRHFPDMAGQQTVVNEPRQRRLDRQFAMPVGELLCGAKRLLQRGRCNQKPQPERWQHDLGEDPTYTTVHRGRGFEVDREAARRIGIRCRSRPRSRRRCVSLPRRGGQRGAGATLPYRGGTGETA